MNLNYTIETLPVTELVFITHKAKHRGFELLQHAHSYHEIIYVDYGRVMLEMASLNMVITPGYIVFIPGNNSHRFSGMDGAPFNFLNICYTGRLPEDSVAVPLKTGAVEHNLLQRIKDEVNSDLPYSKDIAIMLLSELIFILCRREKIETHLQPFLARNNELYHSAVVQQIMNFIEEHCSESRLLDRACKQAGLSRSHLRALVKKHTGHSFGYHIQYFRVEAARKMLLESTLSLKEIANLIGYQSLPFFFKIFRRFVGMSPTEYAKSLGRPE